MAPRVLVADSDPAARAEHCAALSAAGCDVVEAADGRDALIKALVRHPSLAVIDLNLPLVDGIALCEILRRDRVTAHVPILVVTGEKEPARLARAREAGADVLLSKPVRLKDLLAEAQRLLMASPPSGARARGAVRNVARELKRSADLLQQPDSMKRRPRSHVYERITTTAPPATPPALWCPECAQPLRYTVSHVGGVSPTYPEQWDDYECDTCGAFRYRQRTRKLRSTSRPSES